MRNVESPITEFEPLNHSFAHSLIVSLSHCLTLIHSLSYILAFLSLNEFPITETELKLIANAAIIGDRSNPKAG